MKYLIYNSYILTVLCIFLIPSIVYSSSDDGLQIEINEFNIQVRMDQEYFSETYNKEQLNIDFFYIISFCKQNHSLLRNINKDISLWLEYGSESKRDLIISYEKDGKIKKFKRKDHLTLCTIVSNELKLNFDKDIEAFELGYALFYYSHNITDGEYSTFKNTEIEIGAIPGTYQTEVNGRNALLFVYFNKLPEKKYYIKNSLYHQMTIKLTKENFNKYLSGYLGINE